MKEEKHMRIDFAPVREQILVEKNGQSLPFSSRRDGIYVVPNGTKNGTGMHFSTNMTCLTARVFRIIALIAILGLSYTEVQAQYTATNPGELRLAIARANFSGGTVLVYPNTEREDGRYILSTVGAGTALNPGITIRGVGDVEFYLSSGDRIFDVRGGTDPNQITRIENITMTSTRNAWTQGGAIRAISSGNEIVRLEINNCNISTRIGQYGGAIYATNAHITIRNSEFYDCRASHAGGAIRITGGTLNMYDSEIRNSALSGGGQGGAIRAYNTEITIRNSRFLYNRAQYGGAFHLTNTTTNIYDSEIRGNGCSPEPRPTGEPTTQSGAALWIGRGTVNLTRTEISDNRTCGGGGAGGAASIGGGATVTLLDCNISNNSSVGGAAAFHLRDGENKLHIISSTVSGNESDASWLAGGGAIAGELPSEVIIDNSVITGNTNPGGSADMPSGTAHVDIENSVIDTIYIPNDSCMPACGTPVEVDIDEETGKITITPPDTLKMPDVGCNNVTIDGPPTIIMEIAKKMICPTDTIYIEVRQTNLESFRLLRVAPNGDHLNTIGEFDTEITYFEVLPEPNTPIMYFRAMGYRTQGQRLEWFMTDIEYVIILPYAVSRKIDHVSNIPNDNDE